MPTIEAGYTSISKRQIECLAWVARGKSSIDIAHELGLSNAEVDDLLMQSCRRFGVRGPLQAAIVCSELGLI